MYIHEAVISWSEGGEGAASRWWLGKSLPFFAQDLQSLGIPLLLFKGDPTFIFKEIRAVLPFREIHADSRIEPFFQKRDPQLAKNFEPHIRVHFYPTDSFLSVVPLTKTGEPYKVFTSFWRAILATLQEIGVEPPLPIPKKQMWPPLPEISSQYDPKELLPLHSNWVQGWETLWDPSEKGALQCWSSFISNHLNSYQLSRDFPAEEGTSRLSPYLHWGQISVRSLAYELWTHPKGGPFLRELAWREFNRMLLKHFPALIHSPFDQRFKNFPWREDKGALKAWQKGRTGYPLVDAGMRQLWQTGWMHNRVRMVISSFLIKHLLISWEEGHAWFWDTLVDADLANNICNWQWMAGCGIGAAPFFRIFNPIIQSKKFDPQGLYIRRYVSELQDVPLDHVHEPWEALNHPSGYPLPMIDHSLARVRALKVFEEMRR